MRVLDLARFAQVAYHDSDEHIWLNDVEKEGWRRMEAFCSDALHIDTFFRPPQQCDEGTMKGVYQGVIAFRGTADKEDAVQDALLAASLEDTSTRFMNTLEFVKGWILPNLRRFGGSTIDIQLTGHSLGGALALYVSYHTGLPGQVFNAYCSPQMQQRSLTPGKDGHGYRNITLHIVQEDHPVGSSGLAMEGMHTIVYSQPAGAFRDRHSLRNFLGVCQPLEPNEGGSIHEAGAAVVAGLHRVVIEAARRAVSSNPQAAAVRQAVEAGVRWAPGAGRRMLDAAALFASSALKVVP